MKVFDFIRGGCEGVGGQDVRLRLLEMLFKLYTLYLFS